MNFEKMCQTEFDKLPVYNLTLPTGTTIGKRWKLKSISKGGIVNWLLGEYVKSEKPNVVGILWKKIILQKAA